MSNYKKEEEWSTVTRKNKRKNNTKPVKEKKQTNINRKENSREFYQEDRKWKRDRLFQNKSIRRERKSTTTDFPKLSGQSFSSSKFVQSGPKWSNVIRNDADENSCDENDIIKDENYINGNFLLNINYKRSNLCVRNQVPKNNNNVSYNTWEITYFRYLLDLYNIFCEGTKNLQLPYLDTLEAFENFCYFIRDSSSGEISPHVDCIDNTCLEDVYYEYIIKRDTDNI